MTIIKEKKTYWINEMIVMMHFSIYNLNSVLDLCIILIFRDQGFVTIHQIRIRLI